MQNLRIISSSFLSCMFFFVYLFVIFLRIREIFARYCVNLRVEVFGMLLHIGALKSLIEFLFVSLRFVDWACVLVKEMHSMLGKC